MLIFGASILTFHFSIEAHKQIFPFSFIFFEAIILNKFNDKIKSFD